MKVYYEDASKEAAKRAGKVSKMLGEASSPALRAALLRMWERTFATQFPVEKIARFALMKTIAPTLVHRLWTDDNTEKYDANATARGDGYDNARTVEIFRIKSRSGTVEWREVEIISDSPRAWDNLLSYNGYQVRTEDPRLEEAKKAKIREEEDRRQRRQAEWTARIQAATTREELKAIGPYQPDTTDWRDAFPAAAQIWELAWKQVDQRAAEAERKREAESLRRQVEARIAGKILYRVPGDRPHSYRRTSGRFLFGAEVEALYAPGADKLSYSLTLEKLNGDPSAPGTYRIVNQVIPVEVLQAYNATEREMRKVSGGWVVGDVAFDREGNKLRKGTKAYAAVMEERP